MQSFTESRNVTITHTRRNGKVTVIPMDWPYLPWSYIYGRREV